MYIIETILNNNCINQRITIHNSENSNYNKNLACEK
jgi:hypothetical protein